MHSSRGMSRLYSRLVLSRCLDSLEDKSNGSPPGQFPFYPVKVKKRERGCPDRNYFHRFHVSQPLGGTLDKYVVPRAHVQTRACLRAASDTCNSEFHYAWIDPTARVSILDISIDWNRIGLFRMTPSRFRFSPSSPPPSPARLLLLLLPSVQYYSGYNRIADNASRVPSHPPSFPLANGSYDPKGLS